MKPQDIVFITALIVLLLINRPRWFVIAGLVCLLVAIPLFVFWVFFTAQRLVYYGAGFLLVGVIMMLLQEEQEIGCN